MGGWVNWPVLGKGRNTKLCESSDSSIVPDNGKRVSPNGVGSWESARSHNQHTQLHIPVVIPPTRGGGN